MGSLFRLLVHLTVLKQQRVKSFSLKKENPLPLLFSCGKKAEKMLS